MHPRIFPHFRDAGIGRLFLPAQKPSLLGMYRPYLYLTLQASLVITGEENFGSKGDSNVWKNE